MLRIFVALVLSHIMLLGCSANSRSGPDMTEMSPHHTVGIGDAPLYHGLLSRTDESFDFRACDKYEFYFVDAIFSIHDALDQVLQSQTVVTSKPIYIRFHVMSSKTFMVCRTAIPMLFKLPNCYTPVPQFPRTVVDLYAA